MDLPYLFKVGEDKKKMRREGGDSKGGGLGIVPTELTPQQKLMRKDSNRHFRESFTSTT